LKEDTNKSIKDINKLKEDTNNTKIRDTDGMGHWYRKKRKRDTNKMRTDTNKMKRDTNKMKRDTNKMKRDTNKLK